MENNTPLSRVEDILQSTIDNTEYDKPPQSRVEKLLIDLKEVIEDGGDTSAYHPAGSVDSVAELPAPSADYLGYVYDITQAFTTTSDFKEGAGKRYPAGSNIAIVDVGTPESPSYKYDVLSGFIDTSNFVEKEEGKGLSTNDYTDADKTKLGGIAEGAEVNVQSDWNESDNSSDAYIQNKPTLGTASALNVAESGNAGDNEVVKGNDSRLTDDRNPTPHTHTVNQITDFPTLGTAAGLNVPATGDASSSEVVKGNDSRVVNSPIVSTTTGINPSITDSADSIVQGLTVYGRSRVSMNLFKGNDGASGNYTMVFNNETNETTINGTSGNGTFTITLPQLLPAGIYTLSANNPETNAGVALRLVLEDNTTKGTTTLSEINKTNTITTTQAIKAVDVIINGNTATLPISNFKLKIQLELGSTATPYEPYGEIISIGDSGSLDVQTCGKNLMNPQKLEAGYYDSLGYHSGSDYRTSNLIAVRPNTSYSSAMFDGSGNLVGTAVFTEWTANGDFIKQTADAYTIQTTADTAYIRVRNLSDYRSYIANNNYAFQLELGSTATAYEPYQSTSATVTTGIPMYAVGDVKDELDEKRGVVVKRCEKVVFDGSEDEAWSNWGTNAFEITITNQTVPHTNAQIGNVICNILLPSTPNDVYGGTANTICVGYLNHPEKIGICVSSISTAADLKTYLASNPVTVVYELAGPYEIPLTSAELSALRGLRTYRPTTNVTVTDAPTSTVDYLLNTDNGKAVANVQNELQEQIDDKVNKVQGKGLSTNDYDDNEKARVAASAVIDDTTASDSSVYSSNKANVLLGAKADKSETAEYPIGGSVSGDVISVSGSADSTLQNIIVYGKSSYKENIFDANAKNPNNGYVESSYLKSNGEVNSSGSYWVSEYISVIADKYYTLTGITGNVMSLGFYNENKEWVSGVAYQNRTEIVLQIPNDAKYIRISVPNNASATELYRDDIVSIGDSGSITITTANSDSSESSTATLTTGLPYCGIPVTSGETYTDGDGVKWLADTAGVEGVEKRCYKITFDGSIDEDYNTYSSSVELPSGSKMFGVNLPITRNNIIPICNYLNPVNSVFSDNDNCFALPSSLNEIRIRIAGVGNANALHTYFQTNPLTFVYAIATPTTQELTPTEKSALLALRTFDSTTNVTVTDDPFVDISYIKNTNNGKAAEQLADNLRAALGWVAHVPEMHRNILRGKYLGSSVTAAQLAAIADGSFDDLYVGDYWTINNTVYRIADMDFFRTDANSPFVFTTHHLVIVPDGTMYKAKMNDNSATTSGGYKNSDMRTTNLSAAKTTINADFPDMVLTYKDLLVTATSSGAPTASDYFDCDIELMSETMLFGGYVNAKPSNPPYFCASANPTQFALFRLDPQFIITDKSETIWLRDAADGAMFCTMEYSPFGRGANYADGAVRPFFLIGDASNV